MSNQKRRVIYMTDEEWAEAKRLAGDLSVSALIRRSIGGAEPPIEILNPNRRSMVEFRPAHKPSQRGSK